MRKTAILLAAAVVMAGCGSGDDAMSIGVADNFIKGAADVFFDTVDYGGTGYLGDDKVIFPEYFVLANGGDSTAHLGGWCLNDGAAWGGDGVACFPNGAKIAPGEVIFVANYPPPTNFELYWGYVPITFEQAYGFAPDYEIAGGVPAIKNLDTIRGRIRLKHGDCNYDGECWTIEEPVALIDASQMDDMELIAHLEEGTLPAELVVDSYPE